MEYSKLKVCLWTFRAINRRIRLEVFKKTQKGFITAIVVFCAVLIIINDVFNSN